MLTASLIASVLCLATPPSSTESGPVSSHRVYEAKRDDSPAGAMGVFTKAARPLVWGAVATGAGVIGGVAAVTMALAGAVFMVVGYTRAEGVPSKGVADFEGKLDNDDILNGFVFDMGKYSIIGAIFLGAFALIITGAGLGLLVGSLVVRE